MIICFYILIKFRFLFEFFQNIQSNEIMNDSEYRVPVGSEINNFRLERLIGFGSYGLIYAVIDTLEDQTYAMKLEFIKDKKRGLDPEIEFLRNLPQSIFFPKFFLSDSTKDYHFFIMELLGPSLALIRRNCPFYRFSLDTIYHASLEMLYAIRTFHETGFVHRDIKPSNFLTRPDPQHPIVLCDFGLAKRYKDLETNSISNPRSGVPFCGTNKYASLNAYYGNELGPGDDLVSWFYSVVELADGELPWPGCSDYDFVRKKKTNISSEKLCEGFPPQFLEIYNYVSGLDYYDAPDYDKIINMIKQLIPNDDNSFMYDWELFSDRTMRHISAIDIRTKKRMNEKILKLVPEENKKCFVI